MARTGRPRSEKALYSNAFALAMNIVNKNYDFSHIHSVTWSERSGSRLDVIVNITDSEGYDAGDIKIEVCFIDGEFSALDKGKVTK